MNNKQGGTLDEKQEGPLSPEDGLYAGGKTTIAPDVLVTIARLTTLRVEGVSRMANLPAAVNRLFQPNSGDGVNIDVKEDVVTLDLYVVLHQDVNMREISRMIQHEVARAISEMVGMQVGRINVHVEDVDYLPEQSQSSNPEA